IWAGIFQLVNASRKLLANSLAVSTGVWLPPTVFTHAEPRMQEYLEKYLKLRYALCVHIITRKTLIQFWGKHPDSQMALRRWFKIVQKTEFSSFAELRQVFPSADKVDHWIIFNIGGNKYRLITSVHFNRGKVYIRHVLTHAEYDRGDWKE